MSDPKRNWHLQQLHNATVRWSYRDQSDGRRGGYSEETEAAAKEVEEAAYRLLGLEREREAAAAEGGGDDGGRAGPDASALLSSRRSPYQ